MGGDEPDGERIARLEVKVENHGDKIKSIESKLWAAAALILAWLGNQILGIIHIVGPGGK